MKAKAKFVVPVAVVGVLLGGLWVVARSGVSSEQRLADAEPPVAAVAEAELEERVLQDVVTVRGRVEVQSELVVPGPEAPMEGRPVVVDLPVDVGNEVTNGEVVAVVADRPVMLLEMPVQLWRTLQPDDEGPDVERFQAALSALGYPVTVDGAFGPATQTAVRQWYQDRGFDPVEVALGPDPADEAPDEGEGAGDAEGSEISGTDEGLAPGEPESEGPEAGLMAAREGESDEPEMGVVVPLGEVVGVRSLPATVTDLPSPVDSVVTEAPVAVLSPSENVIRADVEPGRAGLLTPGTTGTAEVDGVAESYEVEVVPGTGELQEDGSGGEAMDDGGGEPMEGEGDEFGPRPVVFASPVELGSDLVGSSVRVELTVDSTDGSVLAAPITAVRADADGDYLLVPADGETDGEPERVGITVGASIGGWVEVIDSEHDLEVGETIVLGGG